MIFYFLIPFFAIIKFKIAEMITTTKIVMIPLSVKANFGTKKVITKSTNHCSHPKYNDEVNGFCMIFNRSSVFCKKVK